MRCLEFVPTPSERQRRRVQANRGRMSPRFASVPSVVTAAVVPPTFLRSTAFRGENDENRQDENPGPCRSPAHHYRSAHNSLQSECIMLASVPAALLQPGKYKKKKEGILGSDSTCSFLRGGRFSSRLTSPVISDSLTMEVTAPLTHPGCGATSSPELLLLMELGYPSPPSGLIADLTAPPKFPFACSLH